MDKAIKTKWVKALRSGKYKQARGILKNSRGEMCCLGVLADIQGCDFKKIKGTQGTLFTATLPIGFNAGVSVDIRKKLADMNDKKDSTFAQIANYIQHML